MPESWDLLDAIREFVSPEGWKDDARDIEERIARETGLHDAWRAWSIPLSDDDNDRLAPDYSRWPGAPWVDPYYADEVAEYMQADAPPFLRSRDAAALLEHALKKHAKHSSVRQWMQITWHPGDVGTYSIEHWATTGNHFMASEPNLLPEWAINRGCFSEPIARTLAALEAGHKLGLWPVKA